MNILITGAGSGIGHDLAEVLAYLGHHVYACCHTTSEVMRLSEHKGENIDYLKLDITKKEDYSIISSLDIDVLVNQAGVGFGGSLLDMCFSDIEKNFQVNVFGTLALTRYFIEECVRCNRRGKVLITSSLAGDLPIPFLGSYVATKASLSVLAKILREEVRLALIDVDVKLIKPGAYHTGFNQYMLSNIEKSMYFPDSEKNWSVLSSIFQMLEKKKNRGIVNKMVHAIVCDSSKFVYSAPYSQKFFVKVYYVFKKW